MLGLIHRPRSDRLKADIYIDLRTYLISKITTETSLLFLLSFVLKKIIIPRKFNLDHFYWEMHRPTRHVESFCQSLHMSLTMYLPFLDR